MKIVIVSTWPKRACGIATYSFDLVSALKEEFPHAEIHIVCHTDGDKRLAGVHLHPIIDMAKYNWYETVFSEIAKTNPDVVHLQHEFGIYTIKPPGQSFNFMPNEAISVADLTFKLNNAKIPCVITYHSVYSQMTYEEVLYYNSVSYLADAVIVHEQYQKKKLEKYFDYQNPHIFQIPHGSWLRINDIDKNISKKVYSWQDKLVVGMYGFFEPTKNFTRIIKLWPEIKRRIPNAHLVIEGEARNGSPTGKAEKEKIAKMARDKKYNIDNSIELLIKFFRDSENAKVLAGFDLAVFPYRFASQSGNLAHAYSIGLPVIVSNTEGLASSVRSSKAGYIATIDEDFVAYIVALLKNRYRREFFAKNSLNYCRRVNNWTKVAESHMKVYRSAIHNNQVRRHRKKYLAKRIHV